MCCVKSCVTHQKLANTAVDSGSKALTLRRQADARVGGTSCWEEGASPHIWQPRQKGLEGQ